MISIQWEILMLQIFMILAPTVKHDVSPPFNSVRGVAFFPVLRMFRHLGGEEGFGEEKWGVFGCLKAFFGGRAVRGES